MTWTSLSALSLRAFTKFLHGRPFVEGTRGHDHHTLHATDSIVEGLLIKIVGHDDLGGWLGLLQISHCGLFGRSQPQMGARLQLLHILCHLRTSPPISTKYQDALGDIFLICAHCV